jgi:hypothetical protein
VIRIFLPDFPLPNWKEEKTVSMMTIKDLLSLIWTTNQELIRRINNNQRLNCPLHLNLLKEEQKDLVVPEKLQYDPVISTVIRGHHPISLRICVEEFVHGKTRLTAVSAIKSLSYLYLWNK